MKTDQMIDYFKRQGFDVNATIGYAGEHFTVAYAKLLRGPKILISGEGVARRSHTQEENLVIGREVAINRAVCALYKKFNRKHKVVHSFYMA